MTSSKTILIVDDEDDFRHLLEINFAREGFDTVSAATASEALRLAQIESPDLVVLDLMLPDMSGTEVCRQLRTEKATRNVPVIMLTARSDEIDRVVGFEVGADDYVVKSNFSVRELILRVRAVLRRQEARGHESGQDKDRRVYGDLMIDEAGHRVLVSGEELSLTATEFKLLQTLTNRPGRVQTRGSLLQDVWGMPPDLNTRTVDTHVKRLREKLGHLSESLETVRGVGYRFNAIEISDP